MLYQRQYNTILLYIYSLFGALNICGFIAGISSDGGERMGMTGGEPISGDMPPNDELPDCPGPFCGKKNRTKSAVISAKFATKNYFFHRPPVRTRTCCWEAIPRPPPFTDLANMAKSTSPTSSSSSSSPYPSPSPPPPPLMVLTKSRESRDSQSSRDLLLDDEPLMDAASDLASDNWSKTGLNRSSRN